MANPSKQKGTKFETELTRYLAFAMENPAIERRALTGTQDKGDIAGVQNWTIEAKNTNAHNWALWMDETERERRNAGTEFSLLVVRRRMQPVEKAFAVMPLSMAVNIMIDLEEYAKLRKEIDGE